MNYYMLTQSHSYHRNACVFDVTAPTLADQNQRKTASFPKSIARGQGAG